MILAKIAGLDFNTVGDTAFVMPASTKIAVTGLIVTNLVGTINTNAGVRLYNAPGRTGSWSVGAGYQMLKPCQGIPAAYAYNDLPNAASLTFAGGATAYLNIGVANGSALTGDVYVQGEILDA